LKLSELLKILPEYNSTAPEVEVLSVTHDARHVHLGSVFVAVPGTQVDGHQFLPQACEAGAVAVIVEDESKVPKDYLGYVQVVASSRESLDRLALNLYDDPSKDLFCFGVTGTNGKTSITYMLEAVLLRARISCGVMGTINHHVGDRIWPTSMTTPDPVSLQKRLREMKDEGAKAVAMEISSHALDQRRADGVQFNTVIFTNLTRDHLDYHKSMQEYFLSKQRLFTDLMWKSRKIPNFAIVNTDDPWGARMRVAGTAAMWSYGENDLADFRYRILSVDFARTDFELRTPVGLYKSSLPMCGNHNVANAVAVVAAAASIGVQPSVSLDALSKFEGVPGRLQLVPNYRSLNVFVDYAHSPDALENVLKSLQGIRDQSKSHSQIWTIFGCGGDRDQGKRPLMAKKAIERSDFVMVTSDNPRTEDPDSIIHEIMDGFSIEERKDKVLMEVDRRKAIEKVIKSAKPHDVILIAGKGHEDYQIIGKERFPFSDYEIAKEFLV
jgi:UDP-N-acetylmuramoyl-L-alanyl-D-glutamate--2,6-diaminopimelate ligase